MNLGTSEHAKGNDLPQQYRFITPENLQSQINALSKKYRNSAEVLWSSTDLTGQVCKCYSLGINYITGDLFYKGSDGTWTLFLSGGGGTGGGLFDATVDFSVHADPNTAGTTFAPNTPALTTVLYVSTIDFSQWTYNGTSYVTYVSPFWTTSGNPSVSGANFIGSINNASLKFKTNNIQRAVITNAGLFGFGTPTPSYFFDIQDNTNATFAANITNSSTTGNGLNVNVFSSGTQTIFEASSGATGTTSKFRVKSNGEVAFNNLAGTLGYALISQGLNTAPIWSDLTSKYWQLTGNSGTAGAGLIGTTDNQEFSIITNNIKRLTTFASGNIGIGATTDSSFKVNITKSSPDGYLGLIGPAPSLRMLDVATGTPVLDILWAGATVVNNYITGSAPGDQVMINNKGAFIISANAIARSYPIDFKIATTGNVLIGTNTDSGYKFNVNGTTRVVGVLTAASDINLTGALKPNNNAGTAGQILVSQGSATFPVWQSLSSIINFADEEVPSGTIDGSNQTFTIANTPTAGSTKLYVRGQRLVKDVDYTLTGTTIVITNITYIPSSLDSIIIDYRY